MDPISSDTVLLAAAVGASFLTGFSGSAHCAVMCGPLACVGMNDDRVGRWRAATFWHGGRVMMYAVAGAVLGSVGHAGLAVTRAPLTRALPWVMAAGLVLSAFEVGRRLPALPGLGRIPRLLAGWGGGFSPAIRAAFWGAATPFLPCGLLYGAFMVALGTGSATRGTIVMLAFAAGAIPALAFVQFGAPRLGVGARGRRALRLAVPLLAAAIVVWRAAGASPVGPPHCH